MNIHTTDQPLFSVKKPLFGEEKPVTLKLEGGMDSLDADFGNWIAVDDKGNSYSANFSGSILDKRTKMAAIKRP